VFVFLAEENSQPAGVPLPSFLIEKNRCPTWSWEHCPMERICFAKFCACGEAADVAH